MYDSFVDSYYLSLYRFSSCHDLILSRFCAADYKVHDILGIKIHRITRVHNRMLRYRFDNKLVAVTEEEDTSSISRLVRLLSMNEIFSLIRRHKKYHLKTCKQVLLKDKHTMIKFPVKGTSCDDVITKCVKCSIHVEVQRLERIHIMVCISAEIYMF